MCPRLVDHMCSAIGFDTEIKLSSSTSPLVALSYIQKLLCDKDRLAVLDKFLVGFYLSNKVNFKNCFANKLSKMVRF